MGQLDGKVAAVTGGASGIGLACVERFVAEGARVCALDVNQEALDNLQDSLGDAVAVRRGDVTDEADVEAFVQMALDTFGRLDVAVNCAGLGTLGPVSELPLSEWQRVLDICLTGVFLSTKHESRAMVAGGAGVIVNIASINARQPAEGMSAYCSAKAGVEMFTRVAAMELGPKGVRVCGIGPGLVDTPLTQYQRDIPALRKAYLEQIPLGRVGAPGDIADAALFLVSDQASWVSGDTLFVDGAELTGAYPKMLALLAQMTEDSASG